MIDVSALNSRVKFNRTDVPFEERDILGDATETGLAKFAARWLGGLSPRDGSEGDEEKAEIEKASDSDDSAPVDQGYDAFVKGHQKVFEIPFNSVNKWALVVVSWVFFCFLLFFFQWMTMDFFFFLGQEAS